MSWPLALADEVDDLELQHIYRYVNKYNPPLTVLLHANCYTPFRGARERVTSGGAVWLVVRVYL